MSENNSKDETIAKASKVIDMLRQQVKKKPIKLVKKHQFPIKGREILRRSAELRVHPHETRQRESRAWERAAGAEEDFAAAERDKKSGDAREERKTQIKRGAQPNGFGLRQQRERAVEEIQRNSGGEQAFAREMRRSAREIQRLTGENVDKREESAGVGRLIQSSAGEVRGSSEITNFLRSNLH